MAITTTVQLTGVGGKPPYQFVAPAVDAKTSLPSGTFAIVNTNQLQITSDTLSPGMYTVRVLILDSQTPSANTADKVINVRVVDPSLFTILNENQSLQPTSFPATVTVPLSASGATGSVKWSLLSGVTTLPGVSIDSQNNLVFTVTGFGTWTVGVRAVDALQNLTSKVLQFEVANSQVFSLIDGQVEILVDAPASAIGVNQFTVSIKDSTNTTIATPFSYKVESPVSDARIKQGHFDHVWTADDSTSIILPILGDLSGFTVNSTTSVTNGLTVAVDGVNNVVKVSGPPTAFRNSEYTVSLNLLQGNTQVATISREYTLLSHDSNSGIGDFSCYTRPYIVGDFVGLNPLKPYFNSPNVVKPSNVTVRLKNGQLLPSGLSLDANTGLVYGYLVDTNVAQSILEYVDNTGAIVGTITINWDAQKNAFSLIDNLTIGQLQQSYSGSIASSSVIPITSAFVYRGRLPNGLTTVIDKTNNQVTFSGTPTEAGYFDLWFKVSNQNGQSAFLYHRLIVDYINPLVILTSSLPAMGTNQAYSVLLQGYGGVAPYTWSLASNSPALPTGVTLNQAGLLSGTPTASSYDQNLVINLTDSRGVTTSAVLELKIDNTLTITTPNLPNIVPGQSYSFQMAARGGTAPYTWNLSGTLPSGVTFDKSASSQYGTGLFNGVTSATGFSQSVTITVKDSTGQTTSKVYTLATGAASGMLIDTSGVGLVDRGAPYQGTLRVTGTYTTPVSWQVAPDSQNALPTGLTLNANADNGQTATISGTCTRILSGYSVKVLAVDAAGNSSEAFLLLTSTSSLAVSTTQISPGTINGNYSFQLTANGYNTPLTWSLDSSSPALPSGYSLSSNGVISGVTTQAYSQNIVVKVTDALGSVAPDYTADTATKSLNLLVQNSTLAITTASLSQVTAGRAYNVTLAATGGVPAYTWTVSQNSASQLPTGLTLSSSGVISGTTTSVGFNKVITIRVTDSIGAYVEKQFTLTVVSGLTLQTGIDYTDKTTTSYLGYVDAGSVTSFSQRPNYSFYVVATGVVTTNTTTLLNGIQIGNSGFTASIDSLSNGVAYIKLSGPFGSGAAGDNNFTISVTDSGVTASATFKWKVYNDGVLRVTPSSGSFPQRLVQ